jgi:predicted RNA-binding Zn ribbon-like protein
MAPLWIDFANSLARDHRGRRPDRDGLDDPSWVRRFLAEHGLPPIAAERGEHRAALKGLRALLERFVLSFAAGTPPRALDVDELNRRLAACPVRAAVEKGGAGYRLRLAPPARGIEAVLFAVAASFAEFLVGGEHARLKRCDNPACRWVFYDETRSRTRRWCAESCGNLIKVRKFRAK